MAVIIVKEALYQWFQRFRHQPQDGYDLGAQYSIFGAALRQRCVDRVLRRVDDESNNDRTPHRLVRLAFKVVA